MTSPSNYAFHHNKHYRCETCGKHFLKLCQLYQHLHVTEHLCVHCSHCGISIATWKDRLRHFACHKHALLDGPIFSAEVINEPPDFDLLDRSTLSNDVVYIEDSGPREFPADWWSDENDILVGIILSFRPNGTTTSKGLQKVLQLPFMLPMLQRVISCFGSLDCFLKRHKGIFQSEPMYKLRLKVPREETIRHLILSSSRPQSFVPPNFSPSALDGMNPLTCPGNVELHPALNDWSFGTLEGSLTPTASFADHMATSSLAESSIPHSSSHMHHGPSLRQYGSGEPPFHLQPDQPRSFFKTHGTDVSGRSTAASSSQPHHLTNQTDVSYLSVEPAPRIMSPTLTTHLNPSKLAPVPTFITDGADFSTSTAMPWDPWVPHFLEMWQQLVRDES